MIDTYLQPHPVPTQPRACDPGGDRRRGRRVGDIVFDVSAVAGAVGGAVAGMGCAAGYLDDRFVAALGVAGACLGSWSMAVVACLVGPGSGE